MKPHVCSTVTAAISVLDPDRDLVGHIFEEYERAGRTR
jgi:hypothetical protein